MLNLIFDENKKENGSHYNNHPQRHQNWRHSMQSLILSLPNNTDNKNHYDKEDDYGSKSKGYNRKIDEKSPLLLVEHKINILASNSTIHSSTSTLTYQNKEKVKNCENIRFGFYILFYCFYLVAGGLLFCFTEGPYEMAYRHQFANVRRDFMEKYPSITGNSYI